MLSFVSICNHQSLKVEENHNASGQHRAAIRRGNQLMVKIKAYGPYDGREDRQGRDTLGRASASSSQAVWQTLLAPVVGSKNNYSLSSIQQLSNAGFCTQGLNRESRSCYQEAGQPREVPWTTVTGGEKKG